MSLILTPEEMLDTARYLLEARERVASFTPHEGFYQYAHSNGQRFDKPAMVDASYHYTMGNRHLLSVAIPESMPQEPITHEPGKRSFNLAHIESALIHLMASYGVRFPNPGQGKLGVDRLGATLYAEVDVNAQDYLQARTLLRTFLEAPCGITPEGLLTALDEVGQRHAPSGMSHKAFLAEKARVSIGSARHAGAEKGPLYDVAHPTNENAADKGPRR